MWLKALYAAINGMLSSTMSIFLSTRNKEYSCFNWGIQVEMTTRLLNEVSWCVYIVHRVHSALGCALSLSLSVLLTLFLYCALLAHVSCKRLTKITLLHCNRRDAKQVMLYWYTGNACFTCMHTWPTFQATGHCSGEDWDQNWRSRLVPESRDSGRKTLWPVGNVWAAFHLKRKQTW